MTRDEWQKLHEFTNDDVMLIDYLFKLFKGKITQITNKLVDKSSNPAILKSKEDK
jgi:hypothetical protein